MTVQVECGAYRGELVRVKTRASRRRVDLSSTAARVLRRQLLARKPNERGLVFPSPHGELLNDDNFRHRAFAPVEILREPKRSPPQPAVNALALREEAADPHAATGFRYRAAKLGPLLGPTGSTGRWCTWIPERGFRSDVTVFRLNATAGPIWLVASVSAEYGGTR